MQDNKWVRLLAYVTRMARKSDSCLTPSILTPSIKCERRLRNRPILRRSDSVALGSLPSGRSFKGRHPFQVGGERGQIWDDRCAARRFLMYNLVGCLPQHGDELLAPEVFRQLSEQGDEISLVREAEDLFPGDIGSFGPVVGGRRRRNLRT